MLITAFNGKLILFTEQMLIYFLCAFFCQLPTIIADNAGYDSADLVAKLRAAHTEGKKTYGLGKDFVWRHQMLKYSVLRLLLFKELSD